MAGYRAHFAFGVLTAACVAVAMLVVSWVSLNVMPLVFLFAVIGSMLPDLDSDTGVPVRLLFGTLAVATIGLALFYAADNTATSWPQQGLIAVGAGLFVYFVIGGIFKHFTVHRGVFHSIPAASVIGLAAMSVSGRLGIGEKMALAVGLAITAGYLSHLVLDEINSTVNLSGIPFKPKKSLGTALKLTGGSKITTTAIYVALVLLLVMNIDRLSVLLS
ncbi:metal-dependent hydrolase [Myxococcota bacterium]|nr:metal-dependent hydrolase [Myxococcota bacterium]